VGSVEARVTLPREVGVMAMIHGSESSSHLVCVSTHWIQLERYVEKSDLGMTSIGVGEMFNIWCLLIAQCWERR